MSETGTAKANRLKGIHMDEKFIEVKQLYKTFHTKKQDIEVLKGIDLSVGKGDIYGIVGFSGAGKSTLVRCINRLEEPAISFYLIKKVFINNNTVDIFSIVG